MSYSRELEEGQLQAWQNYQNGDDEALAEVEMYEKLQKQEAFENGEYEPDIYDKEDDFLF